MVFNNMKNIRHKLIELFKEGYCTPQLSKIAKKIREPSATIHYNIKKLENEGAIRTYKAVFDYAKIDEGFCAYILINVIQLEYEDDRSKCDRPIPHIARELAKHREVESLDIIAGEYDMIVKVRTRDQSEFYGFLRKVVDRMTINKSTSLVSLQPVKSDFILQ